MATTRFRLEIDLDNDAFHYEDGGLRTAAILACLSKVHQQVGAGITVSNVRDGNGNTVGKFEVLEVCGQEYMAGAQCERRANHGGSCV